MVTLDIGAFERLLTSVKIGPAVHYGLGKHMRALNPSLLAKEGQVRFCVFSLAVLLSDLVCCIGLFRLGAHLGDFDPHYQNLNSPAVYPHLWATAIFPALGLYARDFLRLLGHYGCARGGVSVPTGSIGLG